MSMKTTSQLMQHRSIKLPCASTPGKGEPQQTLKIRNMKVDRKRGGKNV